MQDNSEFDKLLDDDTPQEELDTSVSFYADLPQEHREFVESLIADYQLNQAVFEGIKNILIVVAANITSCSLALWMIRWGASWYSALTGGLIIALVPGFYDIGKSFERDKPMRNKEGVFGVVKVISASYGTFQAVTNWKDITDDGRKAIESVRAEIKAFEVKPQPNNNWLDSMSSIVVGGLKGRRNKL